MLLNCFSYPFSRSVGSVFFWDNAPPKWAVYSGWGNEAQHMIECKCRPGGGKKLYIGCVVTEYNFGCEFITRVLDLTYIATNAICLFQNISQCVSVTKNN